jgi:hypothetical protein
MTNLFWEVKVLLCDICKERPLKKTIEIERGHWIGICQECEPKKNNKDDKKIL